MPSNPEESHLQNALQFDRTSQTNGTEPWPSFNIHCKVNLYWDTSIIPVVPHKAVAEVSKIGNL
jgi:hypothetical protein